ncbi:MULTISPECIES: hypothetical protein [Bacillus]
MGGMMSGWGMMGFGFFGWILNLFIIGLVVYCHLMKIIILDITKIIIMKIMNMIIAITTNTRKYDV